MSDVLEQAIARLRAAPEEDHARLAVAIDEALAAPSAEDNQLTPEDLEAVREALSRPREDASDVEIRTVFDRWSS